MARRRRVIARPVVRKEIDAERLLQALLMMAREQAKEAADAALATENQGRDSP